MPAALIQGKQIQSVSSTSSGAQVQSNRSAAAAPAVTDDAGAGYEVGSYWIDVSTDLYYVCVDSTIGSAIWLNLQSTAFTLACFEERVTASTIITDTTITGALSSQPAAAACVSYYLNGVFQEQGATEDYEIIGGTNQDLRILPVTGTSVDIAPTDSLKVKYFA